MRMSSREPSEEPAMRWEAEAQKAREEGDPETEAKAPRSSGGVGERCTQRARTVSSAPPRTQRLPEVATQRAGPGKEAWMNAFLSRASFCSLCVLDGPGRLSYTKVKPSYVGPIAVSSAMLALPRDLLADVLGKHVQSSILTEGECIALYLKLRAALRFVPLSLLSPTSNSRTHLCNSVGRNGTHA